MPSRYCRKSGWRVDARAVARLVLTRASGVRLEPEGDRPVIDERHLHVSAEFACLHNRMLRAGRRNEVIEEPLAFIRWRGWGEAWAQAAVRIRGQRELGNEQQNACAARAAEILHDETHLSGRV